MPKKPINWWLWTKMIAVGIGSVWGGTTLVNYVRPTDEELWNKYSPEVKEMALKGNNRREREYADFVDKLKKASNSSKPIWTVLKEQEEEEKKRVAARHRADAGTAKAQTTAMRKETGLDN